MTETGGAAHASDAGTERESHSVRVIYTLENVPDLRGVRSEPLHEVMDFGRFEFHLARRGSLGIGVVDRAGLDAASVSRVEGTLGTATVCAARVALLVAGGDTAQVHLELDVEGSTDDLAALLAATCHHREDIRIAGRSVSQWADGRLDDFGLGARTTLGQDVHQVVRLGPAAARRFASEVAETGLTPPAVGRIVYRDTTGSANPGEFSVRRPAELNRLKGSFAAHARGVTVLGGQQPEVELGCVLTATQLLVAMARLRESRLRTESLLQRLAARLHEDLTLDEQLAVVVNVSESVRARRVALASSVESFIDALFLPELVLDSYRESLAGSLRIPTALSATYGLIDRLAEVAESLRDDLEVAHRELDTERERRVAGALGLVSAVALPLVLVFGYFAVGSSVNIDESKSIFDLDRYLWVWVAATASFAVLVLGVVLLRRKGSRAPLRARLRGEPTTLISAHRGGPEGDPTMANTEAAILRAVAEGAEFVEFDVHRTADGAFLVWHDDDVVVGSERWPIAAHPLADLQRIEPALLTYERVLTLLVGRAKAHIDLKFMTESAGATVASELAEVKAFLVADEVLGHGNFIVTTLDDEVVKRVRSWCRQQEDDTLVGLSLGRDVSSLPWLSVVRTRLSELFPARRLAACDANLVVVEQRLARLSVLRWSSRRGLPTLVWTVDEPEALRRFLCDDRVWLVTTNFPARALALRAGLAK